MALFQYFVNIQVTAVTVESHETRPITSVKHIKKEHPFSTRSPPLSLFCREHTPQQGFVTVSPSPYPEEEEEAECEDPDQQDTASIGSDTTMILQPVSIHVHM